MNVFCSYHFVKGAGEGFGNTQVWIDSAMPLNLADIRTLEREICRQGNFDNTVLLNYQILGEL